MPARACCVTRRFTARTTRAASGSPGEGITMRLTPALTVLAFALCPPMLRAQTTKPAPAPAPQAPATQQPAPQPPGGQQATPGTPSTGDAELQSDIAKRRWVGSFDFGFLGSDVNGDRGRYERYRDLRDGAYLDRVRLLRERSGVLFDVEADHVGRRDQRYVGTATKPGKLRASMMWDQIPMLLSQDT